MIKALYMDDCYLKEWNAEVISVSNDKFVVLNQTGFYLVVVENVILVLLLGRMVKYSWWSTLGSSQVTSVMR